MPHGAVIARWKRRLAASQSAIWPLGFALDEGLMRCVEVSPAETRQGVMERKPLQSGPHFRHLEDHAGIDFSETRTPQRGLLMTSPWASSFRKRLADRDMAGLELLGHVVLHQSRPGSECAADDALGQRPPRCGRRPTDPLRWLAPKASPRHP